MRYAMERRDFEELYLGPDGMGADGKERQRLLDGRYRLSTAQAVAELRTRGLDASASVLDYLIEQGKVPAPAVEGGRRRWTAADIDRAAELLDAEGTYVPGTVMRQVLNLDPAQDERARRAAVAEHPEVVSADYLVLEVLPGAAGAGVRATARYRPMTAAEQAEWKRRVRDAAARREARS